MKEEVREVKYYYVELIRMKLGALTVEPADKEIGNAGISSALTVEVPAIFLI